MPKRKLSGGTGELLLTKVRKQNQRAKGASTERPAGRVVASVSSEESRLGKVKPCPENSRETTPKINARRAVNIAVVLRM